MRQDQYEIAKEAVAISVDRVKREELKNEFGGGVRINLLSAEVDLNTDSVALANAALEVQNARRTLAQMIGMGAEEDFSVDREVSYREDLQLYELSAGLSTKNAAVTSAIYNKRLSQMDYQLTRSTQMPRLALNASYALNQNNSEVGIVLLNQSNGFNGNLSLNFNIFDGFRKSKALQMAEVSIASSEEAYKDALSLVRTQLQNAWASYQNNLYILGMEESSLAKAQLNFQRTEEALNIGQVTTTQFRDAQLNLVRSRMRLAASRYTAKLTEMEVIRLAGRLMEAN